MNKKVYEFINGAMYGAGCAYLILLGLGVILNVKVASVILLGVIAIMFFMFGIDLSNQTKFKKIDQQLSTLIWSVDVSNHLRRMEVLKSEKQKTRSRSKKTRRSNNR